MTTYSLDDITTQSFVDGAREFIKRKIDELSESLMQEYREKILAMITAESLALASRINTYLTETCDGRKLELFIVIQEPKNTEGA